MFAMLIKTKNIMFKNLQDKCLYYRNLTDYKLMPKTYVMLMLDGRSFSKFCKQFKKPYDEIFINMMNETANFLCKEIGNCKFAYVQSDEISIVLSDFVNINSDTWFSYRIEKICSIAASLATAKFNQLMTIHLLSNSKDDNFLESVNNMKLVQFDCKCWNVPSYNDVFAWFLYRQIDCVRNSKQMAAQTYLPHKELCGKNTDEQIKLLKDKYEIDWHQYDDGKKYGRFIFKCVVSGYSEQLLSTFERTKWTVHNAFPLMGINGRERFDNLNVIPKQ